MIPHNLKGKGIWIWKVPQCEGGDYDAIVARALDAGFTHVLIKIADGDDDYQIWDRRDDALGLIPKLRQAGIDAWGWNYIYGDPPARDAGKAKYWEMEAARNVRRLKQLIPAGLQGFVIDAEREYETIVDRHNKAAAYMRILRDGVPDLPLALASWKFPSQHRGFAWNPFRAGIDLDMPQVYWISAHNPVPQLERSVKEFSEMSPRLPLLPAGPAFFEHNWRPTPQDITDFLTKAAAMGLPGANLWTWDHLGLRGNEPHNPRKMDFTAEWQAAASFTWPGLAAPAPAPAPVVVTAPPPAPAMTATPPAVPRPAPAPLRAPAPAAVPAPTADILDRYLAALNARNPDQVVALYNQTAGHVTAQSTLIGPTSIRTFFAGLFAMLPGARFAITGVTRQADLRTFTWTATGPAGSITDGSDMIGLLNGRIQYHHTAYTFAGRQPGR